MAAADRTTPFGSPVEPDVATTTAASGSASGTSGRSIARYGPAPWSGTGATTCLPVRASARPASTPSPLTSLSSTLSP